MMRASKNLIAISRFYQALYSLADSYRDNVFYLHCVSSTRVSLCSIKLVLYLLLLINQEPKPQTFSTVLNPTLSVPH